MALAPGFRLGAYEILSLIGAGGMGEVYKARDTRLERVVALKVLPERLADAPIRRQRFEREARTVAALNHPHICSVLDVGEEAGVPFMVMEYIDGETLDERLVRGPLKLADVLRWGMQIADALDCAHRSGVVHRDLKPANVIVARTDVKLLDFGLSKLQPSPALPALATLSPDGVPLTADGALLGTFPYMAPEHLSGGDMDSRSDIFAFGAVLYEMATGRRAFEGSTTAALIGAILHTDPPPISTLQPLAPPALDRVVSRCLAKDPDNRWQTARDLVLELRWIAEHAGASPTARRRPAYAARWALPAAAFAAGAILFAASYVERSPADRPQIRMEFAPDGLTLADLAVGGPIAISPDSRHVAFVATGPDGAQRLWVRPLDSLAPYPLTGTEGAENPFWSPDGQFIGFFAQQKLRKIAISRVLLQNLCDAVQPRGGTWNKSGVIVFSADAGRRLYRVSGGGGPAESIAPDRFNEERYWPFFLPDDRHFVYRGRPERHGIYVATIDTPDVKLLSADYLTAAYSPPGYLLGLVGASLGAASATLMAQPFDATRLELTGEPAPIAERVIYRSNKAQGAVSVSANGTLAYGGLANALTRLIWFDRSGKPLGYLGDRASYGSPSLSPDEKIVAVERVDPQTQAEDLWLIDAQRDVPTRFTSYANSDVEPVWSPDGSRIVFASPRGTAPNLYQKTVSGGDAEELLVKSSFNNQPTDWSRDGRLIIFAALDPQTKWDLWILPMDDRKPVPFLQTPFNEAAGELSPDGRWIAYVSDESGRNDVYVRTFPEAAGKQRISSNGGTAPRWRGDGGELFYVDGAGTLMAAKLRMGGTLEVRPPEVLFRTRIIRLGGADPWGYDRNYTVTRDGRRFLINTIEDGARAFPETLVFNWPAALARH
jgi:Tol biopolymer transport system component/predicted Ser/Thr protein kinase